MSQLHTPLNSLADSLWQARTGGRPRPPLSAPAGSAGVPAPLTIEDAYRISRLNFERRLAETGARAIGRKIGLTSRAVQKQLGVDQPDYGYLTSDMLLEDGGTLPKGALIQGKAEGEVAFVLSADLTGNDISADDVAQATDCVVACIEIIDSRVADWKIQIVDTIADNASAAYFVLGRERRKLGEIDLRMAGMLLRRNGEIESTGVGAACLDHPLNAVAWLARTMSRLGDPLRKGDIILSGAYGPVVPFVPGDRCEVEINGLGKVSCAYGT